jgi:hypothetical protein
MYLTLQRRTGLWLCLKKRIVRVQNVVVEEEEYNQFNEIPSLTLKDRNGEPERGE